MGSYPVLRSDRVGPLWGVASSLGNQLLSTLKLLVHLVIIIVTSTIFVTSIIFITSIISSTWLALT